MATSRLWQMGAVGRRVRWRACSFLARPVANALILLISKGFAFPTRLSATFGL